ATDVLDWTDNSTDRSVTHTGLYLTNGQTYFFSVMAKNGSALPTGVTISDGQMVDSTPPSSIASVKDGTAADITFASSSTQLSANWTESLDSQSGIAKYWYAVGSSLGATDVLGWTDNGAGNSVTVTGLNLTEGQTYYFRVKAENNAGLLSPESTSNGQSVETTPPPPVATVNDGAGFDAFYALSASQLSANWTEVSDTESGIKQYLYAIGSEPGATDVVNWTGNSQSTSVTHTGLNLQSGKTYYFSVAAENGAGLWSAPANSNGQTVEVTPPAAVAAVNDGTGADIQYATSSVKLSANWTATTDPESGVAKYWYSIGTTQGGTDVLNWRNNMLNISVTKTNLNLTNGQTYYFNIKAENGVGLFSDITSSNGQIVETTPPDAVASVNDGLGSDIQYAFSTVQLSANWLQTADAESGVARYFYAIGTSAGTDDVVDWTDNGTNLSVTRTGLNLTNGQTYYFSVKAENGVGLQSVPSDSDGQTIDVTAPDAVAVVNDSTGSDIQYAASTSELSANWTEAADAESGIAKYWYAIGTTPGGTDVSDWTDNGTGTFITRTGLILMNGVTYYFTVKAENKAGLQSAPNSSNGATVDTALPAGATGLSAVAGDRIVILTWSNPDEPDFAGVKIIRKTGQYPADVSDGDVVYDGTGESFTDTDLTNDVIYYYAAFAYDKSYNYSSTAGGGATAAAAPYLPVFIIREGWNQVGVSMQGISLQPEKIFGGAVFEIVHYSGQNQYLSDQEKIDLQFGAGYWIYSEKDIGEISIGGIEYGDDTYEQGFNAGWNMFSVPFNTSLKWSSENVSLTCGGITTPLKAIYHYDNEAVYVKINPDADNYLLPWKGYWIYSTEACKLKFTIK
ncbi:MAG: hypothetical protein AB1546_05545, partial [bacterium]